jgi:hypothetical protein
MIILQFLKKNKKMDSYKIVKIAECICEQVPIGSRLLIHSDKIYDYVLERSSNGYNKFFFRKGKYKWQLDIREYLIHELNLYELSDSVIKHLDL